MIVIDANRDLLSDAEVGEDVVEDVFGGDFAASDFAEVMETLAKVFCNQVCRDLVGRLSWLDGGL